MLSTAVTCHFRFGSSDGKSDPHDSRNSLACLSIEVGNQLRLEATFAHNDGVVFHDPALIPLVAVGVEQMKLIFGFIQVLVAFEVLHLVLVRLRPSCARFAGVWRSEALNIILRIGPHIPERFAFPAVRKFVGRGIRSHLHIILGCETKTGLIPDCGKASGSPARTLFPT